MDAMFHVAQAGVAQKGLQNLQQNNEKENMEDLDPFDAEILKGDVGVNEENFGKFRERFVSIHNELRGEKTKSKKFVFLSKSQTAILRANFASKLKKKDQLLQQSISLLKEHNPDMAESVQRCIDEKLELSHNVETSSMSDQNLREEMEKKEFEISDLKMQIVRLKKDNKTSAVEPPAPPGSSSKSADEAQALKKKNKTLKKVLQEAQFEINNLKKQHAVEITKATKSAGKSASEDAKATSKNEQKLNKEEVDALSQQNKELAVNLHAAQSKLEDMLSNQKGASAKAGDLEKELKDSNKKLKALTKEKEKKEEELTKKCKNAESKLQNKMKNGDELKIKLDKTLQMVTSEKKHFSKFKGAVKDDLKQFPSIFQDTSQQLVAHISKHNNAISSMMTNYKKEMKERKRLFNLVQELRGNIRVFCRVRPASAKEKGQGDVCVSFPNEGEISMVNEKGKEKHWEFDKVFGPKSTQQEVFQEVSDLCTSILDGYNVCLFAYGQTGSGKTFTMMGNDDNRGVNTRALELLFRQKNTRTAEFNDEVTVSLLEIYNETIRDLLADRQSDKLKIREGAQGMYVQDLTNVVVGSHEEVLELLSMGEENRATHSTDMNEHSSRSHCMLSIYVASTNIATNQVSRGKLHLVDLAGSERVGKSGASGIRLKEAQNINKSLSALGDVISSRANKNAHTPYRNSQLTYLLQDSLQGDSKTLMFACCSPSMFNVEESFQTLNWASRARTVELGKAVQHKSR